MEENNPKEESTIDDVLIAISKSSDAIQKQFEGVNKQFEGVNRRLDTLEHRVGNIDSTLITLGDDIKQVKAGVEKTADILEQKEIISTVEKKQIYHAADPFAMPA